MTPKSIEEIQRGLKAQTFSCSQLVEHYLTNIRQHKGLNAFVEVFEQDAKEKAHAIDQKLGNAPESLGDLFGVVISVKDNICIEGKQVTAASDILQGFTSTFSATAIQKLEEQDAIIIGRTNCDEFAMGSSNEHSVYGPTINGVGTNLVCGGSSGGAAVSVQTDCCTIALGSDTGGSVRQPAAFCGVIGMKPTYGRVSRHGLLAYASSFDQIGVLGHKVQDVEKVTRIISGEDRMDATTSNRPFPTPSSTQDSFKIATFRQINTNEGIHPEILQSYQQLLEQLKSQGHEITTVDFDLMDFVIPAYYVLTTAEASSNLSRYDGIRYGNRKAGKDLEDIYRKSRTEGFGTEVKKRIMTGNFVLSSGYYDAYFQKAQQARRLIRNRLQEVFSEADLICLPTSPTPPWKIGTKINDPISVYLADIFTVLANLAGIPAISLPYGTHKNGLPIGIQFMAETFREDKLFQLTRQIDM